MSSAAKSLEEVLERTGCYARAEERNSLKIAQNMINLGYQLEEISTATLLDLEKVKSLQKGGTSRP